MSRAMPEQVFGRSTCRAAALVATLLFTATADAADPANPGRRAMAFVGPAFGYSPQRFSPSAEHVPYAHSEIARELRALHAAGFRGLVTYAATGDLGSVPMLARRGGFTGSVIMGIWDPESAEEWANALAQAAHVDGYCLGNEGLGLRYSAERLAARMAQLRQASGRPVTTAEPIDRYLAGPLRDWLRVHSDWLFPIAHPYWADQVDPQAAVDWVVARHDLLVADSGRPVILKEAGVPTAGAAGYSEVLQARFFSLLTATGVPFFHFEAFDQPWKSHERGHAAEAHWGLFRNDGSPKLVVTRPQPGFVSR